MRLLETFIVTTTFAIGLVGSGAVRRYAIRNEVLDIPNFRSSHVFPTPRGGGLAVVVAFLLATTTLMLIHRLPLTLGLALSVSALIAFIGFLDDHHQLSARSRITVHIAAAGVAVAILDEGRLLAATPYELTKSLIGSGATIFALTWATNLFNFMDGIDGLAAAEAIFVSGSGALVNSIAGGDSGVTTALLCLCASSAGFLAWNWPPARLFMGDVGSGFLGFALAVATLGTGSRVPMAAWLILGGLFLVDASVTLVLRIIRGERWTQAHRTHAYQQLARRWGSHRRVTLAAVAINVLWLLPWAFFVVVYPATMLLSTLAALVPLVVLVVASGAGRTE